MNNSGYNKTFITRSKLKKIVVACRTVVAQVMYVLSALVNMRMIYHKSEFLGRIGFSVTTSPDCNKWMHEDCVC